MTNLMNFLFMISIAYIFNVGDSFADNNTMSSKKHYNNANKCRITKESFNNYEPEVFEPTNNLLKRSGQESLYCGEKIIIFGKVVDSRCVPIADAKVYMWQVNCSGKYPYKPLKTSINHKLIEIDDHLTFTGNGIATTNNKGEFVFITTYPSGTGGLPPHVNLRVNHYRLGKLQTKMVLRHHKVKNLTNNPDFMAILDMALKENLSVYNMNIVMPGKSINNY